MIKTYLLDGKFEEREFKDFKEISEIVEENRKKLYSTELDFIIEVLHNLGKKIIADQSINSLQGMSYLAMWLRRENLKNVCSLNYLNGDFLGKFNKTSTGLEICAQPRGIVCHWIAGNMPTLTFFSLVQAILSKNGSIVKVPDHNKDLILAILKNLSQVQGGQAILSSLAIVSFDHNNLEESADFSLAADVKIFWGGPQALKAVTALPQKEHCEMISFGPKYSFGVFDREFIESQDFEQAIKNCVTDIAVFNQMACSSPHVLFFEKSKYKIEGIAFLIEKFFKALPEKFLSQNTPESTSSNIINIRAIYLMEEEKNILKSEGLDWTILVNKEACLEEPVQGKVIFIKEINGIGQTLDFITRKIQAMIVCVKDPEKRRDFAQRAAFMGVDRIVMPGKIHDFNLPWDGILVLNRLVRWVNLK